MITYLVLVSAIATIANSHKCIYTPPSIPIDVEKFSGTWYAQQRFGPPFETSGCFRVNYIPNEHREGYTAMFDYKNRQHELVRIPLEFNPIGLNYYEMPGSDTTYVVSFLAVEYDSYAVFYDCSSHLAFSYVLTRSKHRNETLIDVALKEATKVSPLLPWPSKKLDCEIF